MIDKIKETIGKVADAFRGIVEKRKMPPKKIMIDPGHGGKDPGAVAFGIREKDLNWEYALTLKYLLQKEGYKVDLTRWKDVYLSLEERGNKAKGYDAFISIHFNADENAEGCEVWWHPPHWQSGVLAKRIEEELRTVCKSRGVKKDTERYKSGFGVLRSAVQWDVPSVLIEVDFITNKKILPLLLSKGERIKRMQKVKEGINKYFKEV